MKIYFAPLEGITGYVYRNAYHDSFIDADKYFIPFVMPHIKRSFNNKEINDLLPAHNEGMYAVPQIMAKRSEDFLTLTDELKEMGYREVNINAGCPSGTVVSKKRGAGLLDDPDKLHRFLDGIFSKVDIKVSIKTRLGMDDPEEFYDILKVYNSYPFHEVIVHPRVREDYYKNHPNLDMFEYALEHSKNPVVYNGDLKDKKSFLEFEERFPLVDKVMIGRGLLMNPGLIKEIRGEKPATMEEIKAFHDRVMKGYEDAMGGGPNVLFKMKELWAYMGGQFEDAEKYLKKIRKTTKVLDYKLLTEEMFQNVHLITRV